jgi:hypothetical protein
LGTVFPDRGGGFPGAAAFTLAVVCAGAFLGTYGAAAEIVNPHNSAKPKFCLNCHTEEVYSKNCNESEGYCLLGGSVDGICLTCHIKEECCKPGLEHLRKIHLGIRNHPSDVEISKIPPAYYPKTLPIHHGRITCLTCHLHVQEKTGGYKMLRLVKITDQKVDWTVLCQDCHKNL